MSLPDSTPKKRLLDWKQGRVAHREAAERTRSGGIDALRVLAAAMVFVFHAGSAYRLTGLGPLGARGSNGVLLFFVISGYVLWLPFARGTVDLRGYASRRIRRIYPAYLAALIGCALLSGTAVPLSYLLFLQSPNIADPRTLLAVSWTLVIEVAFYATLPLLGMALRWVSPRHRPTAIILVGGMLVLLSLASVGSAIPLTGPLSLARYGWMFIPGIFVAEIQPRPARWLGAVGLGFISAGMVIGIPAEFDLVTVAGAALLVAVAARVQAPSWLAALGSRLSRTSSAVPG